MSIHRSLPHWSLRAGLLVAVVALVALASAASAQVASSVTGLPDTPPARLLATWILAINSKSRDKIQSFLETSWPGRDGLTDQMLDRAQATGGYNVGKVLESTDVRIVVLLQKRADLTAYNTITLSLARGSTDKVGGLVVGPGTAAAAAMQAGTPQAASGQGMGDDKPRTQLSGAELDAAKARTPYRQFSAWLDAFNTGDKVALQKYLETNWPTGSITGQLDLRERSGGFELMGIEQATPQTLVGTLKEKNGERYARFTLMIEADAPNRISRFPVVTIQRP